MHGVDYDKNSSLLAMLFIVFLPLAISQQNWQEAVKQTLGIDRCYSLEVYVTGLVLLGIKFFAKKSGKFPIPKIWEHPLPGPDSVPPIQDWPLPVLSQSQK